ncbi:lipoprotein-releasing ABC transporter permease subunit [Thiomicrorhabdus sp. Milos-T2]|uniref:lipoprotein-releasing ABC transporter permease subunit n=1 Tax=Thiomicrorhabdus sp. Milos-T2 TaxID=90814 RepID=UPI000493F9EE|nr:lipoprotein-releasing ABC transporter permease subunit [Thiomicrorhabdus sp. Milos-T2]
MVKIPYELLLGFRYTRAKRRNGFISFISLSSMLGIALGVTALITVLSIMNGFQEELRDRILGMTAHMTINERTDRLEDWQTLYNQVINQPHVEGAAPNIMEQGMLTIGNKVNGVAIRGVLPEFEGQVADIGSEMKFGSLDDLQPKKYHIILGHELALSLGVSIGDKVTLIAPQGSVSPVGVVPRIKRFTVSGIFEAGMHEYDSGLAIIHIDDAKKVFKYGKSVSGLQLKLDDLFNVGQVKSELAGVVDRTLYMRDWRQQHSNFFKAIEMEKRMMFIVLTLIIMVAAFNIVSTMVMVVTDKQSDIAVLRTIGATPMSIQLIFIIQGLIIGMLGVILGLIGGLSLALNIDVIVPFIEQLLGFKFFPPDIYYISSVPSKLVWSDVWYITSLAFLLTLLATLYPARKASKVNPAEALRYE